MFWFKKKKIVLDCFTDNHFAYEYTRISKATKHFPEWWESLSNMVDNNPYNPASNKKFLQKIPTMKYCRGILDLYKNSFVVPFWGNLRIEYDFINNVYKWNADYKINIEVAVSNHDKAQYGSFGKGGISHLKIAPPWILKTNKSVNFLLHDPIWNRENFSSYTVLPGVMDFKYIRHINTNIILEKYNKTEQLLTFTPANPFIMLTPLSEDNVELRCHLVSTSELLNASDDQKWFSPLTAPVETKFVTLKRSIDRHEELIAPKCPFGFKK